MWRPRSSSTQPKPVVLVPVVPVKLITSPGLIERSIRSTKPLTKFAAIACRPNPSPRPIAPEKTVSAVRSTPEACRPEQHAECDQESVGELADADARRRREFLDRADAPVDPARDPDADDDENGHGRNGLQHRPDRDARRALDRPMESSTETIGSEPAEHFGGNQCPDDQCRAQFPGLDAAALARATGAAGTSRVESARGELAASRRSRTRAAIRRWLRIAQP